MPEPPHHVVKLSKDIIRFVHHVAEFAPPAMADRAQAVLDEEAQKMLEQWIDGPETADRPERGLVEAAAETIDEMLDAMVDRTKAYDRCKLCHMTWYGEREGREEPEPPRHKLGCTAKSWRTVRNRLRRHLRDDGTGSGDA